MKKINVITPYAESNKRIWKDIKCYEGLYEISNDGLVKRKEHLVWNGWNNVKVGEMILKPNVLSKGYLQVALSKNNKRKMFQVHRLVAEAFIENPLNLPQVNHIDGNKKNNTILNLEWTDNRGNQIHAWKNGLQPRERPNQWKGRKGVAVIEIDDNGKEIRFFKHSRHAEIEYGGKPSGNLIKSIKRNGRFLGHKFKFATNEKD